MRLILKHHIRIVFNTLAFQKLDCSRSGIVILLSLVTLLGCGRTPDSLPKTTLNHSNQEKELGFASPADLVAAIKADLGKATSENELRRGLMLVPFKFISERSKLFLLFTSALSQMARQDDPKLKRILGKHEFFVTAEDLAPKLQKTNADGTVSVLENAFASIRNPDLLFSDILMTLTDDKLKRAMARFGSPNTYEERIHPRKENGELWLFVGDVRWKIIVQVNNRWYIQGQFESFVRFTHFALKSENPDVRTLGAGWAVWLGKHAHQSIALLAHCLEHPKRKWNDPVPLFDFDTLPRIGDGIGPKLFDISGVIGPLDISKERKLQVYSAVALGEMGILAIGSLDSLVKALDENDEHVQMASIRAIKKIVTSVKKRTITEDSVLRMKLGGLKTRLFLISDFWSKVNVAIGLRSELEAVQNQIQNLLSKDR